MTVRNFKHPFQGCLVLLVWLFFTTKVYAADIQQFVGIWQGKWANGVVDTLIVESVNDDRAIIVYQWGDDPAAGVSAGQARFPVPVAKVSEQPSETKLAWTTPKGGRLEFTLKSEQDVLSGVYESTQVSGTTVMKRMNSSGERMQSTRNESRHPMLIQQPDTHKQEFRVYAPGAEKVSLAGEMTDWQPNIILMDKQSNGYWSKTLYLPAGRWQYKFVLDGEWIHDTTNPEKLSDDHGGFNSVLNTGEGDPLAQFNKGIPHGELLSRRYKSSALGQTTNVSIYLPPGYQNSKQSYPVMLLLHGYGSDQDQWTRDGLIQNFMDNMLYRNDITPFILVMPAAGTSFYLNTTERFIIDELPGLLEKEFRIERGYQKMAVAGISMGGFGAFYLSQKNPDQFGLSIPLSGYFDMKRFFDFQPERVKSSGVQTHIFVGTEDSISYRSNEALISKLKSVGAPVRYYPARGGHTWNYWHSVTPAFLKITSEFFNGREPRDGA